MAGQPSESQRVSPPGPLPQDLSVAVAIDAVRPAPNRRKAALAQVPLQRPPTPGLARTGSRRAFATSSARRRVRSAWNWLRELRSRQQGEKYACLSSDFDGLHGDMCADANVRTLYRRTSRTRS